MKNSTIQNYTYLYGMLTASIGSGAQGSDVQCSGSGCGFYALGCK